MTHFNTRDFLDQLVDNSKSASVQTNIVMREIKDIDARLQTNSNSLSPVADNFAATTKDLQSKHVPNLIEMVSEMRRLLQVDETVKA